MDQAAKLRIGELSYRVGISADVLRAWEKRYGVLKPSRTEGGYRLYSEHDEWRVRLMQQKLWSGLSAAEAAREVARMDEDSELPDGSTETPSELAHRLGEALESFDEETAHELIDRLLGLHGLDRAIRDALLPYLRDLGARWARREISVAQEHFASRLIEARLLALARGWNRGPGRRAVLACPSGEQHTLPLVCFGLILRNRGWRNVYLGADTPPSTVHMAADTIDADVVVLAAVSPDRFAPIAKDLVGLSRRRALVLGGAGATPELAAELDIQCLHGDPVTAAETLSRRFAAA
ncbi:MAG TPA: MerR family transcriptional regulator [Thermoleophilaceae bacterium]|jgi:DNA-binding transcriptional MerR regulator|nr:MerR family transcriptional regulator [Thermoleophilaceae bacterium]